MGAQFRVLRQDLASLAEIARSPRLWATAGTWTVITALLIAIPTRLVPNSWFARMTPTRPADYLFWVLASLLLGLVMALRRTAKSRADVATMSGGIGTVLAVGCPVCNKVVVALLGVSGALTVFAPIQPVLGTASLVVLLLALRRELRSLEGPTCPVPERARAS